MVSAHGRPIDAAVLAVAAHPKVAVLTAPDQPPEALGRRLLDAGCAARHVVVAAELWASRTRPCGTAISTAWPPAASTPCRS